MGTTSSTFSQQQFQYWEEKHRMEVLAFLLAEKQANDGYAQYKDKENAEKCVTYLLNTIKSKEEELSSCQEKMGKINLGDTTPEGRIVFEKKREFFRKIIELKNELESLRSQLVLQNQLVVPLRY